MTKIVEKLEKKTQKLQYELDGKLLEIDQQLSRNG